MSKEKSSSIKISSACELSIAYLKEAAFVPGTGSHKELSDGKVKGIKMYLQPNGQVWCEHKAKWFMVPESNVNNTLVLTKVELS